MEIQFGIPNETPEEIKGKPRVKLDFM